ncbi:hypothetical protein [Janthinobacterium sp. B9-8]|uniref:hypothetical protein n=1 Tax=Janthinobacterium sp. B9-8 TaxID=1236179 RepID=UPI00061D3250|nr:hypothetical protein [Janthinobacterium sp. B9-8]AMC34235.1 hypothetical protein VN23_06310 [Janthinobacterium sp. B9-8]
MKLRRVKQPNNWHLCQLQRSARGNSNSYCNAVESGNAVLFEYARENGEIAGCVLLRVEKFDDGLEEAVIVACGGKLTLAELREAMRELIVLCEPFDSIRTHVTNPALARIWRGMGFVDAEIVLRKEK